MTARPLPVSSSEFLDVVQAHLDGWASDEDVALLRAHEPAWVAALLRLLDDASKSIDNANRELKGAERALVVGDFEAVWKRIDEVLTELIGPSVHQDSSAESSSEASTKAVAKTSVDEADL